MKIQNLLSGRPQWNRFSRSWLIADKPSSRSSPAPLSRAKENPRNPCPVNSWTLHYQSRWIFSADTSLPAIFQWSWPHEHGRAAGNPDLSPCTEASDRRRHDERYQELARKNHAEAAA